MRIHALAAALSLSLAGCGTLFDTAPPQLIDLSPKNTFEDGLPTVAWQLVVDEPNAPTAINTDRIAIRPTPLEIAYYDGVRWTDRAPAVVQTLLVESFENSGKILGVGRQAIGLVGDYQLRTELREFEARILEGAAIVHVRVVLKLIRTTSGQIVASEQIERQVQAASDQPGDVAVAFDDALGKVLKRAVAWTLTEGERDRRAFQRGG